MLVGLGLVNVGKEEESDPARVFGSGKSAPFYNRSSSSILPCVGNGPPLNRILTLRRLCFFHIFTSLHAMSYTLNSMLKDRGCGS